MRHLLMPVMNMTHNRIRNDTYVNLFIYKYWAYNGFVPGSDNLFCDVSVYHSGSQPGFRGTLKCRELVPGMPSINAIPWSLYLSDHLEAASNIYSKGAANQKNRLGNTGLLSWKSIYQHIYSIREKLWAGKGRYTQFAFLWGPLIPPIESK